MLRVLTILMIMSCYINPVYSWNFEFDLEDGLQGWTPDFADYNINDSINWNLGWEHDFMPGIEPQQKGINLHGDNFSDDLFLYIKREITGLEPDTEFEVTFEIQLVTNESYEIFGGYSLMLKAGATLEEPLKIPEDGIFRLNIDKGNQFAPGKDMDTLGQVVHRFSGDDNYHLITLDNKTHNFKVKTDKNGKLWFSIGAESAFEISAIQLNIADIKIRLMSLTGIDKMINENNITLYPNPADDHFSIQLSENYLIYAYTVYNIFGEKVFSNNYVPGRTIMTTGLINGIYIVNISTNKGLISRKLVIE